MAEDNQTQVGWPSAAIVVVSVLAIAWIAKGAIDKYTEANEVVSVVTAIIGPLAGIAAAAFGIKLGADAKAETKGVKEKARDLADKARDKRMKGDHEVRGAAGAPIADPLQELENDLRRLAE